MLITQSITTGSVSIIREIEMHHGHMIIIENNLFMDKVHIIIDSASGLQVMLTVTKAGYGESRTVPWFVKMLIMLGLNVNKFIADAAYDSNKTRLMIIKKLKAIPFIMNTRNCKGKSEKEKRARRKMLCIKFYAKNFIKQYIDPDSEEFDREYDARTFSEQGFSIGKGSLNLDLLRCKGLERETLHSACICIVMLLVALQ